MSDSTTTKYASAPKRTLAEMAPAPDTTLMALQPVATLIDSSTWPGPFSRASATSASIPASPTIVPRSGSSGSTGSDGRTSPTKGDARVDRFKLEQRKLLSAIKSDPTVGIAVSGELGGGTVQEAGENKQPENEEEDDHASSDHDSLNEQKAETISGTTGKTEMETRSSLREKAESKGKKAERSDSKSPVATDSSVRGVKLGTGMVSRSASGSAAARPSSTSSGRVRTTAPSVAQRRSNITGLPSGNGGSTAGMTLTSTTSSTPGPRQVLTRYPPATNSASSSAAATRRSLGSQPSASATQQRLSAGSASASPQKQKCIPPNSPSRHSFESSLRSYSPSLLSTSEAATALAGNAARTRRISGERSHGIVRDMTAGTQTKTGLTSSPTSSSSKTFATAKANASGITKAGAGVGTASKSAITSIGVTGVASTFTVSTGGVTKVSGAGVSSGAKSTAPPAFGVSGVTIPSAAAPGAGAKLGGVGVGASSKSATTPTSTVGGVIASTTASTTASSVTNVGTASLATPPPSTRAPACDVGITGTAASSRFHEKCLDSKLEESQAQQPQTQPAVTKDLSHDRTPRFV